MAIHALNNPFEGQPILLNPEVEHKIKRRVAAIAWTARYHPCRPQCLHRSLVLYGWLRNQGIPAQLEVGWGDGIGHAWVSYGDKVLNDRADIS
ncbi:MAG: lasso peptide biosynthesis B2 protein, partial [Microcystaceae cyanobacterium]